MGLGYVLYSSCTTHHNGGLRFTTADLDRDVSEVRMISLSPTIIVNVSDRRCPEVQGLTAQLISRRFFPVEIQV